MENNLIYDVGFHKGEDTKQYLKDGYKVVAIEANPQLVEFGKNKFKKEIESGQLILLNIGVGNIKSTLDFWVNDYCSEWSSFDKEIGCRNNTACHCEKIECLLISEVIEKYGLPFYLKIDIEGNDIYCIEGLNDNELPKYISCEAQQLSWLETLRDKGYTKFKIINQADRFKDLEIKNETSKFHHYKRFLINGIMHRTSDFIDWKFPIKSSGPYGENTSGKWKTFEEVKNLYLQHFQFEKNTPLNNMSWFDFHATK